MSGMMRIDQSYSWIVTGLHNGPMVGIGTADVSVDIVCSEDLMPDGTALSRRVRELFTQALVDALRTEDRSVRVEPRERG